jgi:hypothetical protein
VFIHYSLEAGRFEKDILYEYNLPNIKEGVCGCSSVECLLSMHKALGLSSAQQQQEMENRIISPDP